MRNEEATPFEDVRGLNVAECKIDSEANQFFKSETESLTEICHGKLLGHHRRFPMGCMYAVVGLPDLMHALDNPK